VRGVGPEVQLRVLRDAVAFDQIGEAFLTEIERVLGRLAEAPMAGTSAAGVEVCPARIAICTADRTLQATMATPKTNKAARSEPSAGGAWGVIEASRAHSLQLVFTLNITNMFGHDYVTSRKRYRH
jgi:hypothetical protein